MPVASALRRMLARIQRRTLRHPLIYERLRPWILGYHDLTRLFQELELHERDVVLDIGCGSGASLSRLERFKSYHGFDVDPAVLARLCERFPNPNVHCYPGEVRESELSAIQPTKVLMIGLLHHLDDQRALDLLGLLRNANSIERIITLDPIYVTSAWFNNLLCRFDSGEYVRAEEDLVRLVRMSGLSISSRCHTRSGNGLAHYIEMCLTR